MKKFSDNPKSKTLLEIQDDTINYISAEDIDKYLSIASKSLRPETKEICKWLKVNNKTYLHDLDPSMNADNALAAFYNAGIPKDEHLKELYNCIGKVVKAGRTIEIPVFQTKEQFEAIINKKVAPDEILLDLETEAGRNKVSKDFQPLVYKIVNQYMGKANLSYEELLSAGEEGLVFAMNRFGKPKKRDEHGKWIDMNDEEKTEKHTALTFAQFAAFYIKNYILIDIENSHIVRVPKSQQKKEREELKYNIKNREISGDKTVGTDSDGKSKTVFDYIEDVTHSGTLDLDNSDIDDYFKQAYAKLEQKFGKEDFTMLCRVFKINGYQDETKNQKQIAAEYGLKPTTFNVRLHKMLSYCMQDKQLKSIFDNIRDLMSECRQLKYEEEDELYEAHKLSSNLEIN